MSSLASLQKVQLDLPSSKLAWVVENAFTPQECEFFISTTDLLITDQNAISHRDIGEHREQFYGAHQATFDIVWGRLREVLPATYQGHELVGFDEKIRFNVQYEGGQVAPHFDLASFQANSDRSFITVLIYLNDNFKDGHTRFFDNEAFLSRNARSAKSLDIRPARGQVVIFQHDTYHCGALCVGAAKYALRFDAVYSRHKGKNASNEAKGQPERDMEEAGEEQLEAKQQINNGEVIGAQNRRLLIGTRRNWVGRYAVDHRGHGEDSGEFPMYELTLFDDGHYLWTVASDDQRDSPNTPINRVLLRHGKWGVGARNSLILDNSTVAFTVFDRGYGAAYRWLDSTFESVTFTGPVHRLAKPLPSENAPGSADKDAGRKLFPILTFDGVEMEGANH